MLPKTLHRQGLQHTQRLLHVKALLRTWVLVQVHQCSRSSRSSSLQRWRAPMKLKHTAPDRGLSRVFRKKLSKERIRGPKAPGLSQVSLPPVAPLPQAKRTSEHKNPARP